MEKSVYETGHQMGDINNFFVYSLLLFFPILGIGYIALGTIYLFIDLFNSSINSDTLKLFFLSVPTGVFLLIMGLFLMDKGLAKYRFEKDGLIVKYPLRKEKIIPWTEFQQVCVCYGAYTTRGTPRASTVICCVKKGEEPNIYGRWKTDNPFRSHSVITIDYKPEYYNGIKERCPYDVPDLRNTLTYRLD